MTKLVAPGEELGEKKMAQIRVWVKTWVIYRLKGDKPGPWRCAAHGGCKRYAQQIVDAALSERDRIEALYAPDFVEID